MRHPPLRQRRQFASADGARAYPPYGCYCDGGWRLRLILPTSSPTARYFDVVGIAARVRCRADKSCAIRHFGLHTNLRRRMAQVLIRPTFVTISTSAQLRPNEIFPQHVSAQSHHKTRGYGTSRKDMPFRCTYCSPGNDEAAAEKCDRHDEQQEPPHRSSFDGLIRLHRDPRIRVSMRHGFNYSECNRASKWLPGWLPAVVYGSLPGSLPPPAALLRR